MINNSREAIIDWKLYKNPFADDAIAEVAGAHCEAGVTDNVFERINDFKPRRSEKIDRRKEHGEAEYLAHKHSFELMDSGYNFVVWISPPDAPKKGPYTEGRINFMGQIDDNFDGWGIPAMRSGEELIRLARKLEEIGGVTMDGFEDVEGLRRQSIGFKNFDEKIKNEIEEIFNIPGFWKYVEGEQKIKKAKIIKATRECLEISQGNNQIYFKEMEVRGYKVMEVSDHGVGNIFGAANFQMFRNMDVKMDRVDGKMVCPCGEVLDEGASKCPRCGLNIIIS